MSSSEEQSSSSLKSVHKKRVLCYCDKCKGKKYVDPRTKQDHMALPDIGTSSKTTKSSSSKYEYKEEPLPEFPSGSSDDSEDDNSKDDDAKDNSSDENSSDENGSDDVDSESSESESEDNSDEKEDNIELEADTMELFPEDEQATTSRKLAKGKFKAPIEEDEEMIIGEPTEKTDTFDVYQLSDEDDIMIIREDNSSSPSSSSNNSNDSLNESSSDSQENQDPVNFIPPEIDPEVFDPPFDTESVRSNDWITLWIMKYQQRYNIPDTGTEALIKFLRQIFLHFKIDEADRLLTSMNTAKSSLGILTKYRKYAVCPKCHKLYDPSVIKNFVDNNKPASMMCNHVEYPYHRTELHRSACNEPLALLVKTKNGILLRPSKIYPAGSIKQQLYMMYQRAGFEKMLRHSSNRNVPNGIFSDIYEGNIWKNFVINLEEPTPFFTNDTLDTHIGLAINIDWFQPFDYTVHSTGVIYGVLCNLPREERFKPNNILTLGIIPGPNEPSKHQINNYLAPIVDELVAFASGIDIPATFEYKNGRKIYVALILSSNDVPAARKICGHASHAVKCHRCPKRATYDSESKRNHYGGFENMDEWFNPVDITKYFDAAKEWLNCTNKQERDDHVSITGVRWSELYQLKYFDPVKFIVVDPMHCLFLGIGKWIMKQCLLNNNKLSKQQLKTIEKRMSSIKVPSDIGRIPSKIAQGSEGFS